MCRTQYIKPILIIFSFIATSFLYGQQSPFPKHIIIKIADSAGHGIADATVSLLRPDSTVNKIKVTNDDGETGFDIAKDSQALFKVSSLGFISVYRQLDARTYTAPFVITLLNKENILQHVEVVAKVPLIQMLPDKTVVNVESSILSNGSSILEVLERSPGVFVDRSGNISLKGRPSVLIMVDGKPVQVTGQDLQQLLSGINASTIEKIELMENPPAKYDAAGNAGIINIVTKRIKQVGFNGSINTSYGQGVYHKNNHGLQLNFRKNKLYLFLTYGFVANKNFTDLYAHRKYYDVNDAVLLQVQQPFYTTSESQNHRVSTGLDYKLSEKTNVGATFSGMYSDRTNHGRSEAVWYNGSMMQDSVIATNSRNTSRQRHGSVNVYARHKFNAYHELSVDADVIGYDLFGTQYFINRKTVPVVMANPDQARADIPSGITIYSAKADYSYSKNNLVWETGWKSSIIKTDNKASFYTNTSNTWQADLARSNHFLYDENIHALYTSIQKHAGKWNLQGGLRYELTDYKANQLGNGVSVDSSFNRNYNSFFPTAFVTYEADSLNSFTFRAGRRIDRPAFQKLNPFLYIINKYTYQSGNPYLVPQYTWNFELGHLFKSFLNTSVSYNYTNDYFSQVFTLDPVTGIVVYTDGNIGHMHNIGASVSLQKDIRPWWFAVAEVNYNYKEIKGSVQNTEYNPSMNQVQFNLSSQFNFKKGWAAELSGFYITRSQNDLQEVLDPNGQVTFGLSKQVLKDKGNIRFSVRDIFYTQRMQGHTYFNKSDEFFTMQYDTRVATLSFTYKFGKMFKPARTSSGSAADEIQRAGN
jgi:iron complex outermembrane receptor protein